MVTLLSIAVIAYVFCKLTMESVKDANVAREKQEKLCQELNELRYKLNKEKEWEHGWYTD